MNSIIIEHPDGSSYTFDKISVEGFEWPEVINVVEDIAGASGAKYITSKFGRRRLSFQSIIEREDRNDALAAFRVGSLKTLKFTTCDNVALQTYVEVERVQSQYRLGRQAILVEMVAPDYRFLSQSLQTFSTAATVVMGGVDIPADIPMSFTAVANGSTSATNGGTEMADPVFTIAGPGTSFLIRNNTTGLAFTIDYTLLDGEFIEVDFTNKQILFNGITPVYSSFSGIWWQLEPGANIIGFSGSGFGANTLLTIEWHNSYIGI